MKRVGLWAMGIGLAVTVGLLTVAQGYAEEKDPAPPCTLTTLKGTYLFAYPVWYVITNQGSVPLAVAGKDIFNGDGTGTSLATNSFNGDITRFLPAPVSYTVNADCTGTFTVHLPTGDLLSDIFIAPNGDEFSVIATDTGLAGGGMERRVSEEHARTCTLATLKGRYLFAGSGTLLPPAFGVSKPALFASAGYHIFNGDGTGIDIVTFSIDGAVVVDKSETPVSYTVNPDCTGTYTVPPSGPSFDLFIAPNGEELTVIETDLGVVGFQAPQRRVAPK